MKLPISQVLALSPAVSFVENRVGDPRERPLMMPVIPSITVFPLHLRLQKMMGNAGAGCSINA